MLRTQILGMTLPRRLDSLASAWTLVVLAMATTACPGDEPGTDGTATEAGSSSTGAEPMTAPPTTLSGDSSTTDVPDGTTTVSVDSSTGSGSTDGSGSGSTKT